MTSPWYWAVFGAACVIWVAVPIVAYLERRSERRDREAWAKQPGAVPETTLRDLAAALARHEWQQPDMRAAADADLGARIGLSPGRRADHAQTVREQSLDEMRLK